MTSHREKSQELTHASGTRENHTLLSVQGGGQGRRLNHWQGAQCWGAARPSGSQSMWVRSQTPRGILQARWPCSNEGQRQRYTELLKLFQTAIKNCYPKLCPKHIKCWEPFYKAKCVRVLGARGEFAIGNGVAISSWCWMHLCNVNVPLSETEIADKQDPAVVQLLGWVKWKCCYVTISWYLKSPFHPYTVDFHILIFREVVFQPRGVYKTYEASLSSLGTQPRRSLRWTSGDFLWRTQASGTGSAWTWNWTTVGVWRISITVTHWKHPQCHYPVLELTPHQPQVHKECVQQHPGLRSAGRFQHTGSFKKGFFQKNEWEPEKK